MKRIITLFAVAMLLCAGSAFAHPEASIQNKTTVEDTKINNTGKQSETDIGVIQNKAGSMGQIYNETTVSDDVTINNTGKQSKTQIGVVENLSGGNMPSVSNVTEVHRTEINNTGKESKTRIGVVSQGVDSKQ